MATEYVPEDYMDDLKRELATVSVAHEKCCDAMIPGAVIAFDQSEAANVGAFTEGALSEQDALESRYDARADDGED
jgi:hypothetical protein